MKHEFYMAFSVRHRFAEGILIFFRSVFNFIELFPYDKCAGRIFQKFINVLYSYYFFLIKYT